MAQPETTTSLQPSRTDRRRERTRARLVSAGRALVAEKGVAGLRISEITGHADVALGSFYNHFATKEELVEAVVAESLGELAAAVVDAGVVDGEDPAATVARAVRQVVRLAFEDPEFARLVVNLSHSTRMLRNAVEPWARRALELGITAGRFADVDVEVMLTIVPGGAVALMDDVLEGRHAEGADLGYATAVLRSLGVAPHEAQAVAARVLPAT